MIFSSLQYMFFLPLVAVLYWRTTGGVRLTLMVAASYFFYMSWLPAYGLLLAIMSTINWLIGLALSFCSKNESTQEPTLRKKALLGLGLAVNLGCLAYYKYANFFLANIAQSLEFIRSSVPSTGWLLPHWQQPVVDVLLPLGISFFVFEFVHYLVDVYRGGRPIKSWMEFALFAAFFPSQIAGPIKRYQDFIDRTRNPEPWTGLLFYESMALIMQGLFKKVAIADLLGYAVYAGFMSNAPLSTADALIASIGFVIQVYCDFSGYTDIGRGSALLLGIRLPENFQLPYLAHDITDFWRRWHMSLSSWLRDYVFIPLGGSRGGYFSTWCNSFLTMVACGLWHGAAWHYVVFGAMQGLSLVVNRQWRQFLKSVPALEAACGTLAGRSLSTFVTMSFVTASFIVFRAPDMGHAFAVFSGFANIDGPCLLAQPVEKSGVLQFLIVYMCFWLLTEVLKRRWQMFPDLVREKLYGLNGFAPPLKFAAWSAVVLFMVAAKPSEATPFVYFQF